MKEQMVRLNNMINERVQLMLKNPEINAIYQSKPTLEEAQDWITKQALVTLYFSVEERQAQIDKLSA